MTHLGGFRGVGCDFLCDLKKRSQGSGVFAMNPLPEQE